ncbi:hypothetical protein AAC387_Pa10g1477 [Persea americana]
MKKLCCSKFLSSAARRHLGEDGVFSLLVGKLGGLNKEPLFLHFLCNLKVPVGKNGERFYLWAFRQVRF